MALSQIIIKRVEELRPGFPTEQALLIPLLHFIQEERGWISIESQREVAEFLNLPLSKVKEVVTFYTMFNLEPVGKVHLQLCANISCWLNGAEKLHHCIEKRFGIKCGESTADGRFTYSEVECLASCGTAPVLQVNEDYHEKLSVDGLQQLLDDIEKRIKAGDKSIGYSTRTLEV